jgi:hypothetical protein
MGYVTVTNVFFWRYSSRKIFSLYFVPYWLLKFCWFVTLWGFVDRYWRFGGICTCKRSQWFIVTGRKWNTGEEQTVCFQWMSAKVRSFSLFHFPPVKINHPILSKGRILFISSSHWLLMGSFLYPLPLGPMTTSFITFLYNQTYSSTYTHQSWRWRGNIFLRNDGVSPQN